jgi:hypothetical protein
MRSSFFSERDTEFIKLGSTGEVEWLTLEVGGSNMLSASEASRAAGANRQLVIDKQLEAVEQEILMSIAKGYMDCYYLKDLMPETIAVLTDNGYVIKTTPSLFGSQHTISWKEEH